KIELKDRLRFNPTLRHALCRLKLFREKNPGTTDPQAIARSVSLLCDAARLAPSKELLQEVEGRINCRMQGFDAARFDIREFVPDVTDRRMAKAAVLKSWISERERGVVFVSFEHQWARLLWQCDLKAFARRYILVVSPTWSPPHGLINYVFPAAYPDQIFTLISNNEDVEHFRRISKKNIVVPLLA